MANLEDNDDLLIRWLDGSLTKEELENIKNSEDYRDYGKIISEVDSWELPSLDVKSSYSGLKNKLPSKKTITWYQTTAFRLAASIALIALALSYIFLKDSNQEFSAGISETKEFFFPDSSSITLRPGSTVLFNPNEWTATRKVRLTGRAFFDVRKGQPFSVEFGESKVEVLGTSFEITSEKNFNEVICYSGKVRATINQQVFDLPEGKGVTYPDLKEPQLFTTAGFWARDRVNFQQAPLSVVLESLEKHFGLSIESDKVDVNRSFTGAFTIDNADEGLEMVLETMDIDYEKNGETVTLQ
ncbi:MAG: FecR domain-containing protein [Bacteroidota bacterium]